ncbi:TIGR03663 family protein [Kiritimatiellaeota bacterium B1221]|nr:TIGR03663 family protein [Kiritimatiellaeota bacterium B1221]
MNQRSQFIAAEKKQWILLIILSLGFRFIGLGERAMSHDESLHAYYSWTLSQGLNYEHNPMTHGPLLFHLNGLVYALFSDSDFASLLFPAFWGTGCVAIMMLFRKWLGTAGALCSAAFISLDPGHLFYSRYLRNDIMVSFFTLLMLWAILEYRDSRKPSSLLWLSLGLALQFVTKETCYIVGAVFGSACVFFAALETPRRPGGIWIRAWFSHPLMHCAALMLLLALPFAGTLLHPLLGWDPLDNRGPVGQKRIYYIAGSLFLCSVFLGSLYFGRQKRLQGFMESLGIFWIIQILLFTTLFTNAAHGMASGLAGSLGYWLQQHDVKRGNSDPFFYVTLLLLYSPVLIAGALLSLRKIIRWPLPMVGWLFLGNLLIYSWAGERMPWLLLHISLPLCILTGTMLPPLFAAPGRKGLKIIMALGCFQMVCNSLRVNAPLSEGPSEPLVYAHSGKDIKLSLYMIQEHLAKNPGTRLLINDKENEANSYTWPLVWYFKEGGAEFTNIQAGKIPDDVSVILVPPRLEGAFLAEGWIARLRVDMTTWPRPQYHRITLEHIDGVIRLPAVRKKFLQYYFFRKQPEWGEDEWPIPNRYLLMTR